MVDSMRDREPDHAGSPATADIVVVNWNAGDWLRRCIRSIEANGAGRVGKVAVVDNASIDGSDQIESKSLNLEVIRTGANLGFGRACNIGARRGRSPYLLFLNPDAAFMPGALDIALDFMEEPSNCQIGVCGVKLIEEDGSVQRHCARLPSPATFLASATGLAALLPGWVPGLHERSFDHLTSREVDHVIGAFYLIRRNLFEKIGGFDERFFMYLEDLDLSVRVHKCGYRVFYLADAVAFHRGGGTSEQVKPQRLAYALDSRIIYSFKHFTTISAFSVAIATLCFEPFSRLARALRRCSPKEAIETGKGFTLLWARVFRRAFGQPITPVGATSVADHMGDA